MFYLIVGWTRAPN